jgi:5-formyltetrahydrofolate cyclo-ligase
MDISQLRRDIIEKRKRIPENVRSQIFDKILERFFDIHEFKSAKAIIAYYGKTDSGEFDTKFLLNYILLTKKDLYLPRCRDKEIGLDIYQIHNIKEDMENGKFGLIEPKKISGRQVDPVKLENLLVIVPGSVFDHYGNRLGYGMGFYDRFLAQFNENPATVAFSYSLAVMESRIETNIYDIPVDIIITEKEIIRAK